MAPMMPNLAGPSCFKVSVKLFTDQLFKYLVMMAPEKTKAVDNIRFLAASANFTNTG